MASFLLISLVWFVFAFKSAEEEVSLTWPFRNLDGPTFTETNRLQLIGTAHKAALVYIAALALLCGLLQGVAVHFNNGNAFKGIAAGLLTAINAGLIYWLIFDIRFATGIGKAPFYITNNKDIDRLLKRFGHNAGKKKAFACGFAIAAIHLLYYAFLV